MNNQLNNISILHHSDYTLTTIQPNVYTQTKINFTWYDYAFFIAMLVFSIFIGLYFGFIKKQSTANEYLLGGRTMKPLPIAMSLVASKISGVALLAIPADVYQFGTNYWISCLSVLLTSIVNAYVYLPVFHNLQLTSTYEYLQLRFNSNIRKFASFLFGLSVVLHLPLVIYVPALALEQVTDINIHIITPIICGVCIFYTTIGGFKAVVWTDMLQFTITLVGMFAVFYMGVMSTGGLSNVFQKASEGQRLEIDFDINPTLKDSFWVIVLGWSFNSLSMLSVSQSCVQKFMALPTLYDAKMCSDALGLYILGAVLIKTTCIITGLIMYAKYIGCDPITSNKISKPDQILPYYVMDVAHDVPGLPGLFIAGIFCASLSTLSAAMNCLAGTIYEDFVSNYMPKSITQKHVSVILKCIVVIIGIISVLLVRVVEHLGHLLPIIISFTGVASGPLLGIFTLGILFPRANSKGALVGAVTALITIASLFIMVQYYKAMKLLTYSTKPLNIDQCDIIIQKNSTIPSHRESVEIHAIFRISFYYYTLIGATITIIIGNIVSFFTHGNDKPVHVDLLSPLIRRFQKEEKPLYQAVKQNIKMVSYNNATDEMQKRL